MSCRRQIDKSSLTHLTHSFEVHLTLSRRRLEISLIREQLCTLFRPPGTMSSGQAYVLVLTVMYLLFSPRFLRDPSIDRPETLPHGRNMAVFYNPTPKIRGGGGRSPKKFGGQKHPKFRSIFDHFRLWSRISPERLKICKIRRRYKLWQFLLRLTKKVR